MMPVLFVNNLDFQQVSIGAEINGSYMAIYYIQFCVGLILILQG